MPSSCPRCQAQIEATDAFCPNCGAALSNLSGKPTTASFAQAQPGQVQPPVNNPRNPQPQSRKRPWYRKKRFMVPITMLIILGMIVGGGAWYLDQQFEHLQEISTPDPDSIAGRALQEPTAVVTPSGDEAITMLLMGVDSQEGEGIDIGVRPDSISVLHINPKAKTCRVVSIPRDTRAELPGYGQSKINHALSVGGIEYQMLVTQQTLGIKIDHFALVDFGGVVGSVDALGGVHVNNPAAFEFEDVQFAEGPLHLNGEEALLYSRYRGGPDGDFGRQQRQQEVVRGMIEQFNGLDAARAIPGLLQSIDGHFKTDLKITSLISMAGKYRSHCTADRVESVGLDGSVGNEWDDMMGQELSFVHISDAEIDAKVRWLRGE